MIHTFFDELCPTYIQCFLPRDLFFFVAQLIYTAN